MELIIERCLQLSDKDQRYDQEDKCDSKMLPDKENKRENLSTVPRRHKIVEP